jgi:hypothetical protein
MVYIYHLFRLACDGIVIYLLQIYYLYTKAASTRSIELVNTSSELEGCTKAKTKAKLCFPIIERGFQSQLSTCHTTNIQIV